MRQLDGISRQPRPQSRIVRAVPVQIAPEPVIAAATVMPAPTPQPMRARWPYHKLYVALVIVALTATTFVVKTAASDSHAKTPVLKKVAQVVVPTTQAETKGMDTAAVKVAIDQAITQNPSLRMGVSVIDIESGGRVTTGSTAVFTAASTSKVLTAAAFMQMVEQGKASLGEKMGSSTAGAQLRLMINQSNNNAWALLNSRVGYANLEKYAHGLGLASYSYNGNLISVADDATLLQLLYTKKLVNETDTDLILSYMQNTNNESLIPAALPNSATVHHKYGQLDGNLHDTAIITYNGRDYVLSIYTTAPSAGTYSVRAASIGSIVTAVIGALPSSE